MTRIAAPFLVSAFMALALAGPSAAQSWMTEDAMRAAFVGKTLDGYYADRREFTETYTADGRLQYRESSRRLSGSWYLRGNVFCTIYDPGQELGGGCFTTVQVSANCYEFYVADLGERERDRETTPGPRGGAWTARASRRGEPSTCEGRPTV